MPRRAVSSTKSRLAATNRCIVQLSQRAHSRLAVLLNNAQEVPATYTPVNGWLAELSNPERPMTQGGPDTSHGHDHGDGHGHTHGPDRHGHTHGRVDPSLLSNERGLWAVKWSFVALFVTASLQLVVVMLSHSVALFADTIHNFGDAATGIPLAIAFVFARRRPTRQFPFGYGRVEDLAGLAVVLTIFSSAVVAGYQAVHRLLHPQAITHLGAIAAASIIGFLGNELVAIFRIRVGKEIGSAALIADGYHARTDGWTSLAVLLGATGVHLGFPKADPVVGLVITVAILGIVWQSVKTVFVRMLDGVEPEVLDEVRHAAARVPGVLGVTDVRARWVGHRLHVEANVSVAPDISVEDGHSIAKEVEHVLRHHLGFLQPQSSISILPANLAMGTTISSCTSTMECRRTRTRRPPHSHPYIPNIICLCIPISRRTRFAWACIRLESAWPLRLGSSARSCLTESVNAFHPLGTGICRISTPI